MTQLTPELINHLLSQDKQACISIYLPTEKVSPASHQNPIRFENLLKQAKQILEKSPHKSHQLKNQLQAAAQKLDDETFWQHQKRGLAVFITESDIKFLKLPLKFAELVSINHHCHFKPLLPLLTTNGKFHILTLSQNDIKLYQATRTDIDKLFLGDIPTNLEDTLYEEDLQKSLQFHTGTANRRGSRAQIHHGQGAADDKRFKQMTSDFIRQVARGVDDLLEPDRSPLVLAGVDFLVSMYRKHSDYPNLTDDFIEGNPQTSTKQKLHQQAWKIVRPLFKKAEQEALDAFHAKAGTGQTATNLPEILPAASGGRVHSLFVLRDHQIWGTFDLDKNEVKVQDQQTPQNEDLIDLATILTLQNSGQVFSLKQPEMPRDTDYIAALFRY